MFEKQNKDSHKGKQCKREMKININFGYLNKIKLIRNKAKYKTVNYVLE